MAARESRYDPVTDWYVDFASEWGSDPSVFFPTT